MVRAFRNIVVFSFLSLFYASGIDAKSTPAAFFDSLEKKISTSDTTLRLVLDEQLSIAVANGDSLSAAHASYVLGKYYLVRTFDYSLSYIYFLRALANFETLNDIQFTGKAEMQLGLIYFLQRNFEEAEGHFLTAFSKMKLVGDSMRIGRLGYLLGLTYSEKKDFYKSRMYLKVAGDYAKHSDNDLAMREYLYGMGMYFLNSSNADSALHYLIPVYEFIERENDLPGKQKYGSDLAKAWWLKGDVSRAKQYAENVIRGGRNVGTDNAFVICYHLMYEIAITKGDYKNAVSYLNKYILLKDSIFNEKNLFDIAALRTKFLLEKELHRRDLVETKKDAEQQAVLDNQMRRNNFLLVVSISFLVLVAFLIIAIYFYRKQNHKLKSTQEQLVHQEKLASMGRLSSGIAHEIRNPLNFINNFSDVSEELIEEIKEADDTEKREALILSLKDNLGKIKQHGKRAESIVRQFIEHIHSSPDTREPTDINQLCDTHLKIVLQSNLNTKNIHIQNLVKNYASHLPNISVSPQQIGTVFINVFTNAFHALEDKFQVETFTSELSVTTFTEDRRLNIVVTDNGSGIRKEIMKNIFDPFFTTRPPGKGAGLGLSVANDIVKSHGGEISVQSDPGVLTSVRISIPY